MMMHRAFVLLLFILLSAPAVAGWIASPDVRFQEAVVRLIAQRGDEGTLRGGIEIKLAEGFKTYWKNPGDSGVPPQFDVAASRGIRDFAVKMPLPERFDDGAGGVAFGYQHSVLFPFEAKADAAGLVVLKLDFAVCGKLCIPLAGTLTLDLAKAEAAEAGVEALWAKTVAHLPKPATQGAATVKRVGAEDFVITLPSTVPPAELRVFPMAPGFFEVKAVEAVGAGKVLIRLVGQAAPGTKTFGPLSLTYGTAQESFERVFDVDAAQ